MIMRRGRRKWARNENAVIKSSSFSCSFFLVFLICGRILSPQKKKNRKNKTKWILKAFKLVGQLATVET